MPESTRQVSDGFALKRAAYRTPMTVMLSVITRGTICTTSFFAPRESRTQAVRSPSKLLQKLPRLPCRSILNVIKRLHEACEIFRRIDVIPALGTGYGEAGLLGTAPKFRGRPARYSRASVRRVQMQSAQAHQVIAAVLRGP